MLVYITPSHFVPFMIALTYHCLYQSLVFVYKGSNHPEG